MDRSKPLFQTSLEDHHLILPFFTITSVNQVYSKTKQQEIHPLHHAEHRLQHNAMDVSMNDAIDEDAIQSVKTGGSDEDK